MNKGREIIEAIDARGEIGFVDLSVKSPNAADANLVAVRLGDGATVYVAANRLATGGANKYRYEGSFEDARRGAAGNVQTTTVAATTKTTAATTHDSQTNLNQQTANQTTATARTGGEIVVPLIAEEINIGKRIVETGGVRVHKTVREEVRRVDEPFVREHLDIERVEINQFVEVAPGIRYEGDVMIVPVLEEVVVTQKKLLLREEVRIAKRREETSDPQEVVLRREEINLERID